MQPGFRHTFPMDPSTFEPDTPTPLSGGNAAYLESLYADYLRAPSSVAPRWRAFFDALKSARDAGASPQHPATSPPGAGSASEKQGAVSRLIQTTSNRGHL